MFEDIKEYYHFILTLPLWLCVAWHAVIVSATACLIVGVTCLVLLLLGVE
jgi:hypothetical protein